MSSRKGARVFLGNLPRDVREGDIEDFFRRYGRIRNIDVKTRGYGFCEFDDHQKASTAVYKKNGKRLLGIRVTVEHARVHRRDHQDEDDEAGESRTRNSWMDTNNAPKRTDHRVIVENLSTIVSWQINVETLHCLQDLMVMMRKCGNVTYANAHHDKRNEGIVEFNSSSDADRAVKHFNNIEVHGRRLKVFRRECSSSPSPRSTPRSTFPLLKSSSRSHSSKDNDESKSRSQSLSSVKTADGAREDAGDSRRRSSSNSSSSTRHATRTVILVPIKISIIVK